MPDNRRRVRAHLLVAAGDRHWTKHVQVTVWLAKLVQMFLWQRLIKEQPNGKDQEHIGGLVNIDTYSMHRAQACRGHFVSLAVSHSDPATQPLLEQPYLTIEYLPVCCTGQL